MHGSSDLILSPPRVGGVSDGQAFLSGQLWTWEAWPRLCLLGGSVRTLRMSQEISTFPFWIYSSEKTKRQEIHPCETCLLPSDEVFKVTVKGSGRSGCSGTSFFLLAITDPCPVPILFLTHWSLLLLSHRAFRASRHDIVVADMI